MGYDCITWKKTAGSVFKYVEMSGGSGYVSDQYFLVLCFQFIIQIMLS